MKADDDDRDVLWLSALVSSLITALVAFVISIMVAVIGAANAIVLYVGSCEYESAN